MTTNQTLEARAVKALQRTWQAIGYDVLDAYGSERRKHTEEVTLNGEDVAEAVSACGFVGGYPEDYGQDYEAVAWLETQTTEEQDRILKAAFPLSGYGM